MMFITNIIKRAAATAHRSIIQNIRNVNTLQRLTGRQIIRVSGGDSLFFLQGLVTNDMRNLERRIGAMYAMFLNIKGRVLYDAIIYKATGDNSFLIECDTDIAPDLVKHLKLYRVKRKVDISNLKDNIDVYALYDPELIDSNAAVSNIVSERADVKRVDDVTMYADPRTSLLGYRIIASTRNNVFDKLKETYKLRNSNDSQNYRWFRYTLGVGEGTHDLPPTKCFPLESNLDYLHGISFQKGCYIGQELTARTYHTGRVRKRLMPFHLSEKMREMPESNQIYVDKSKIGVLRGVEGNVGLALMRHDKVLEMKNFIIENRYATAVKPIWWPPEAMEKVSNL